MYKNNNLTGDVINELIAIYKLDDSEFESFDKTEVLSKVNDGIIEIDDLIYEFELDRDKILELIFGRFIGAIEKAVYNKLKVHDEDTVYSMLYSIAEHINKDHVSNYFGYICKNLKWNVNKYIEQTIFYPEFNQSEIDSWKSLNGKLSDDIELSDKEKARYNKIESKKVYKTNIDAPIKKDGTEETLASIIADKSIIQPFSEEPSYRFQGATDILTAEELELLNLYYIEKKTYREIGNKIGYSHTYAKKLLDKIVAKIKLK